MKTCNVVRRRANCVGHDWSSNMALPFIDHSSGMWNFHLDRLLCRCPCSMRKVKP
jgi:hypothetical protein